MQKNLKKAIDVLKTGGIVAHATDTCYGFACDIFNKSALERLYKLKQMSREKPVSILVADLRMARRLGFFNKTALMLARKYWPGPFTIIVKRKKSLPSFFNPRTRTVGIRIPKHALSQELSRRFGGPLTTTSANISGKPSLYSASAIHAQFKHRHMKPDFILDSGKLTKNPPSTIIDVSGNILKIIRGPKKAI